MGPDATSIELTNNLSELKRLAEALEAFGWRHALSRRLVTEINVALEELVTNIIEYGFDEAAEHTIRIELQFANHRLVTRIVDDGRAFDPTAMEPPDTLSSIEEREVGGLGILLVKRLMDEVVYSRDGERNVLLMTKYAGATAC